MVSQESAALAATPAYVQGRFTCPQSTVSTVSLAYSGAQTAGNLNVVLIGWNGSTQQVSAVTDSAGNSYAAALAPTVLSGKATHVIYYAKGIRGAAAGANTVTVTFTAGAPDPDLRIVEYSGIDPVNALDVAVGATGTSNSSSSGALTTTNATDLLVAGNYVQTSSKSAGSGYTLRLTTTPDSDVLEDRNVTATGAYTATTSLTPSGWWVMQQVAFRAAGGTPDTQAPTAPTNLTATAASATQINLTWTASTDNVGVTSYLVERCQGAGCTTFTQVATVAAPATTLADGGLTPSTSYSYRVRATDAAANLSGYSNTAGDTTPAAGDTQAPTAPTNLTATAASATQINLAWTASTDNVGVTSYLVERCQEAGCSTFAQVGTVTAPATTFADGGLTPSTSYSYRVRAADAAANLGGYSNTASATTPAAPDTQPPTAPANLTATAASASQVNLSWTAATDNVGVTQYLVERCQGSGCSGFAQIGMVTATSFADAGLAGSTAYSYRVRATDAAANLGPYSNTASATTPAASGTTTPKFVQAASTCPQSQMTAVTLAFPAAQTVGNLNVVAIGWNDSTAQVSAVTDTMGNAYAAALSPTILSGSATQVVYYAKAIAGAAAGANTVRVSFTAGAHFPDVRIAEYSGIDPLTPVDVTAGATGTSTTSSSGTVTTTNASDLLVGANYVATSSNGAGTGFTLRALTTPDSDVLEDRVVTATGAYGATVPLGSSGWWVMQMVAFRAAASGPPDTQPPTAPGNLTATAATSGQINLAWAAATDNVGVASTLVERCQGPGCSDFAQVGMAAAPATTFADTGVAAGTSYSYRVRATDAAANIGPFSNTATATTPTPDTQPPTAPSNLVATAVSSSEIDLTWTAATDDVGVVSTLVERCVGAGCTSFTQIGATAGTTFANTGLAASASYSYRVRAADAAGNQGPYGSVVTATTTAGGSQGALQFVQEGLTQGLDRLREPAAASAIPFDPSTYNLPYGAYFVDVNGDGPLDLWVINHGQAPHRSGLWLNNAPGGSGFGQNLFTVAFSGGQPTGTGWMPPPADIDGDGLPDIYTQGWYNYGLLCHDNGVSTQNGWTGATFSCQQAPYQLTIADVNNDGRPDIRTYDPSVTYDAYLAGCRALPAVWKLNDGTANAMNWPVGGGDAAYVGVAAPGALLDVNADGLPDIVQSIPAPAGARGAYSVATAGTRLLLGRPGGGTIEVASGFESVIDPVKEVVDVNEDGCLDVGFDPTAYRDNSSWYLQEKGPDGCSAHFHAAARTSPEFPYYPGMVRYAIDLDNSGKTARVVIVTGEYSHNDGYAPGVHVFVKPGAAYVEVMNHGINLAAAYYAMLDPGDWNGDGLLDLAGVGDPSISNSDHGIGLWTNQTVTTNHYLDVKLPDLTHFAGVASIEVYVAGGAGNVSSLITSPIKVLPGYQWPTLKHHFGLGTNTSVDVRVVLPSGTVVVLPGVTVDQTVTVNGT